MEEIKYTVIITGALPGNSLRQVIQKLARLTGKDASRFKALEQKKPLRVKSNVDKKTAILYKNKLKSMGISTSILPISHVKKTPAPIIISEQKRAPTDKISSTSPIKKWARCKIATYIGSLFLAGLLALFRYEVLPNAASTALTSLRSQHGLDVTVDDWRFDLLQFNVTALDTVWKVPGQFQSNELLQASKIRIDLNLFKFLTNDYHLSTAINTIEVSGLKIHFEHKNDNLWNLENTFTTHQLKRLFKKNSGPNFNIHAVHFTNSHIEWFEELPGNSHNGIIERRHQELHIDDANIVLLDIKGLFQAEEQPIRVNLEARASGGLIQMNGIINPFLWKMPSKTTAQRLAWTPMVDLSFYLENIPSYFLGKMVPDDLFTPQDGSITGKVSVVADLRVNLDISYQADIHLDRVSWQLNELSSQYTKENGQKLKKALAGYTKTGMVSVKSKGRVGDKHFRLFPSIQTSITREAISDVSPLVRKEAAGNQLKYEDRKASPVVKKLEKTVQEIKEVQEIVNKIQKNLPTGKTPSIPALPKTIAPHGFGGFRFRRP